MKDQRRDQAIEHLLRERRGGDASSVTGVCLDVEVLAAWMDDTLAAEERVAAESHVADCAGCQALLAAMAKTAPSLVERAAWWRRPAFAWAIPVTAVAAALVIWIVVPNVDRGPSSVIQVADSRTSNPPAPQPTPPPQAPRADTLSGVELETRAQKPAAGGKKELQAE